MYKFNYENATDLEKFNHIAAITLDEVKALIDQIVDVLDIDFVKEEHLNIVSSLLNYPLDREDNIDFKRKQLKVAIDSYKVKGTEESIKVLFYTLGLNVEVIPLWTPNYVEEITLTPPFIRVISMPSQTEGYKDLTIINPDEQLDTIEDSYRYV